MTDERPKGTVLIIKSERTARDAAAAGLKRRGFKIITADSVISPNVLDALGMEKIPIPKEKNGEWEAFEAMARADNITPFDGFYLMPKKGATATPGLICCLDNFLAAYTPRGEEFIQHLLCLHKHNLLPAFNPEHQVIFLDGKTEGVHAVQEYTSFAGMASWIPPLLKKVEELHSAISQGNEGDVPPPKPSGWVR